MDKEPTGFAMRPKDLDLVRNIPLLAGIGGDTFASLTSGASLEWCSREAVLVTEGEVPDFLHVLVTGAAALSSRADSGQETVLDILCRGACFAPAAVLADAPSLTSARLLDPSQILLLSAPVVRAQVARDPVFAHRVMQALTGQFRTLVREVKDLKLRNTTQRLSAFILDQVDRPEDGVAVELPVSRRVLASRLGMTPEQLSRTFAKLSDRDLHISGSTIIVRSIERLRRLCSGGTP